MNCLLASSNTINRVNRMNLPNRATSGGSTLTANTRFMTCVEESLSDNPYFSALQWQPCAAWAALGFTSNLSHDADRKWGLISAVTISHSSSRVRRSADSASAMWMSFMSNSPLWQLTLSPASLKNLVLECLAPKDKSHQGNDRTFTDAAT